MSEVIRLLPDHIANQIAAGEVIQRPASVVKELVENALDAGATRIDIHIRDAGKTLIQVLDDGFGMSETDARMAFERHATSKLNHADDLFALKTKGFRGEALASIAAIAHVTLQTRMENQEWGTSITIEGSQITDQSPVTCKKGSSFAVKNLFFNVPARRNFLKTDAVEFKHIEDEFQRIVLAHPETAFQLTHNDQLIHHLDPANLRKRIVDVFGRLYNDRLVPVNEKTGIVEISGFIGKPEFAKKSRGEQFFFVNDRFFKDSYFNHALTQAYDNLLTPKTFPCYFLFFKLDPASIDVNVHPTKTEIKFEYDRDIYSMLKSSVRQSLGQFNLAPSLDFEQETGFELPWEMKNQTPVEPQIKVNLDYNPFKTGGTANTSSTGNGHSKAMKQEGFGSHSVSQQDWDAFYGEQLHPTSTAEEDTQQQLLEDEPLVQHKQFIYQHPFIICPVKTGLLLVHARRARERITYDELMQTFMSQPIASQQVLFPLEVPLSASATALWLEQQKLTERLGFLSEKMSDGIQISGIPAVLDSEQAIRCVQQIAAKLEHETPDKGELAHEFMLSVARGASMKQMNYHSENCSQLIDLLFACIEHQYSPGGKRIVKTLAQNELMSHF